MRLKLELLPDMSVLTVVDGGERTEVRGHPLVGTRYEGDTLDRLLKSLSGPQTSVLHSGDDLHMRSDDAKGVRAFLREEDRLRNLLRTSVLRVGDAR